LTSLITSGFATVTFPEYFIFFSFMFHTSGWTEKWIPIMGKIQLNVHVVYISLTLWFFSLAPTKQ
jgi:hypothetical protein